MRPQDVLKLAVRVFGLVFLYRGLETLPTAVIQFFTAIPSDSFGMILAGLLMVGWPLAVAYWLLRGAPLSCALSFPKRRPARRRRPGSAAHLHTRTADAVARLRQTARWPAAIAFNAQGYGREPVTYRFEDVKLRGHIDLVDGGPIDLPGVRARRPVRPFSQEGPTDD